MKNTLYTILPFLCSIFLLSNLSACSNSRIRPINNLNSFLFKGVKSHREPDLGINWLVTLSNYQGKEKIELIDLRNRRYVSLPGLNRSDSQPISASISADGNRIAFIAQRLDKTELFIFRRNLGTTQRLELIPKGIPRRVTIDGKGRVLAVQVSRDGAWDVDLIRLQG